MASQLKLATMPVNINNPMLSKLYSIENVVEETNDIFTLNLSPNENGELISFEPGQFNMVYVYGVGEVPISISGDPSNPNTISHTTRCVGTVTNSMGKLKKGDMLGVRGPFGSKWPIEEVSGNDVVIVAGGVGLAPLRSAIYKILAKKENYGNVSLLYGTRSPEDIIYREELDKWNTHFDLEIDITVDRATDDWEGNVGVVTSLIKRAKFDPLNTVAFICGPEIMMKYTVSELQKQGVDENNIFISIERNMKCAVGFCGRCQYGPTFICKDGPVFGYTNILNLLKIREL